MMRILWLSDFYPPSIGGLERHVQMVVQELASRGHDVSVGTIWHEGAPSFEIVEGVKVYRLMGLTQRITGFYSDTHRRFHPTAPDPLILNSLLKIIAKEKPQIVIASGWIIYSFLPIKPFLNVKLFVRHHDYAYICAKRTLFFENMICTGPEFLKCYSCTADHYGVLKGCMINTSFNIFSKFHGLIDRHLPISRFVAEAIQLTNQVTPSTINIVPAPVPDEILRFEPSEITFNDFPNNESYILYVGALSRHKGLNVLLDAYKGLENKVKLVIIGTEWPDSPLSYPEGITVIKNAPHNIVMEAFSHCLFSVVPSLWPEPFGQVAVEAMAASKPVIASRIGGLTDIIIQRETGILVEPGNSSELHNEMKFLLDEPDIRRKLGSAGHSRAKQYFTRSKVTDQIELICKEALIDIKK